MRGQRCGATIFYAIRETRVMTKNIATVLPKWARLHLAISINPFSAALPHSSLVFSHQS